MTEDSQVERKVPKFRDLTGEFFPERKTFIGRLRDLLVNHQVEKTFWTPERKELAKKIVAAVNEELEPFGAPKVEFRQDQVRLLKKEAMGFVVGSYLVYPGYIELCPEFLDSDEEFIETYTHELLHHLSLHLLQRKGAPDYWSWRRRGLEMILKPGQGDKELFKDFDEGVIRITAQQILEKYFSLESSRIYLSLGEYMVKTICATIFMLNPQDYPSSVDVFKIFQKATFGKARALELGRLIERTYGRGSFRKLGELLVQVPREETIVKNGKRAEKIDTNSPEYKILDVFINWPLLESRFRMRCKVLEGINPQFLKSFDFSKVPPEIPLGYFSDEKGKAKEGLLIQIGECLESLSRRIGEKRVDNLRELRDLVKAIFAKDLFPRQLLCLSGNYETPGGRGGLFYKRKTQPPSFIWDSDIDRWVKDLVFDALDKEETPATTFRGEGLEMTFYRTKNLTQAPLDIYCLIATESEKDLTAYALALAPKGVDPQVWWADKNQ